MAFDNHLRPLRIFLHNWKSAKPFSVAGNNEIKDASKIHIGVVLIKKTSQTKSVKSDAWNYLHRMNQSFEQHFRLAEN